MTGGKTTTPRASAFRWAVVAGALVVLWLGERLPLPGLSPEAMAGPATRINVESLSVFALGVTPILTSWFIVELARLAIPPLARVSPGRLAVLASALALALAGLQAANVGAIVQAIPGLIEVPGFAFRAGVIAAMIGATAVLLWLADVIDRWGVGDGLLLLFAGQTLAGAARQALLAFDAIRAGSEEPWAGIGAVVLACALAAVAARGDGGWRGLDPWPALLAFGTGALVPSAAILVGALFGASVEDTVALLISPLGRTILAALTTALFGLFALMRSGGAPPDARTFIVQLLVVFGGGMLWLVSAGGPTSGCTVLLFAAAATSLVARGQPRLRFE